MKDQYHKEKYSITEKNEYDENNLNFEGEYEDTYNITEIEHDTKSKIRNLGNVVFPAESKKVTDKKDHFIINTLEQGLKALARVHQYSKVPAWYKGTLEELVSRVECQVQKKYPNITK